MIGLFEYFLVIAGLVMMGRFVAMKVAPTLQAWSHPPPPPAPTYDQAWIEACWEVDELAPQAPAIAPYPRTFVEKVERKISDQLAGSLVCPNPRNYVVITDMTPPPATLAELALPPWELDRRRLLAARPRPPENERYYG